MKFQIRNSYNYTQKEIYKIVITGGTFNGTAFADITDWNALCAGNLNVTISEANGVKTVTITNPTYTK